jgi:hypothetical protein
MEFKSWNSIEQFRNVCKNVQHKAQFRGMDADGNPIIDRGAKMPMIRYHATVKIHGTNAGILLGKDGTIGFQSRNNIITPEKDNAAFAFTMNQLPVHELRQFFAADSDVYIFGEWCGENIQKGVAVCQLPKMFVVFGAFENDVRVGLDKLKKIKLPKHRIFNIHDFFNFEFEIDFENPHHAQYLLTKLVEDIEEKCPVGAFFGVTGVGEGVVCQPVDESGKWDFRDTGLWFKVKGSDHSASKVKTLASPNIEHIENIKKFVGYAVTESRLNQGLDYLREQHLEIDTKNTGAFLKWISNDVMKEESDTMSANGLDIKHVGSALSKKAREWFMNHLE